MRLYDISLPIGPALACWPGDTPYQAAWNARLRDGDTVNLSTVTMSVHTGTHIDAPLHFRQDGPATDELDLTPYLGPAVVIGVEGLNEIHPEDLIARGGVRAPRLLLRTGAWPDRSRFPDAVPVLAPETPAWLHAHGVVLFGLDVPSVDLLESQDLPIHRSLDALGIRILESLCLDGVPDGEYELIALPLRFEGADGSPVRAVLRQT